MDRTKKTMPDKSQTTGGVCWKRTDICHGTVRCVPGQDCEADHPAADSETPYRWSSMRVRPIADSVEGVTIGAGEYVMTQPEMVALRDMLNAGIERLNGKAGG